MGSQLPWIISMFAVFVVPAILAWLNSRRKRGSFPTPEACTYRNVALDWWLCIDPKDKQKIGGGETKKPSNHNQTRN